MTGILPNRIYIEHKDQRIARVDMHRHAVVEITNLAHESIKVITSSLCNWFKSSTCLGKSDRDFLSLAKNWRVEMPGGQNMTCQDGILTIREANKGNYSPT